MSDELLDAIRKAEEFLRDAENMNQLDRSNKIVPSLQSLAWKAEEACELNDTDRTCYLECVSGLRDLSVQDGYANPAKEMACYRDIKEFFPEFDLPVLRKEPEGLQDRQP